MMRTTHKVIGKQQGAALVIGLVLLVVLTLLAVTGMNTASSELLMAGNEQYRQNAFQASEAGIEQALSDLPTVPQSGTPVVVASRASVPARSSAFTTRSRAPVLRPAMRTRARHRARS
jgi:type IV pilus assembly protein PilX